MKIKQRKVILLNLKGSLKVFEDDISISIDSKIVGSGHVDVKTKDYSYKDPTVASHVNAKGAITLWWGYTKGTILGHGVMRGSEMGEDDITFFLIVFYSKALYVL